MAPTDSAPDTDSANDAWLSQTVGAPCPDQTGTLGLCRIQLVRFMSRWNRKKQRHPREGGDPSQNFNIRLK